ncbi:MAG: GNAT family N-acetyltransferase [Hamadaea sp.]|uniref:GNAT family N-acetyltransferase n=1 Tax=Hamadaea sp. TaxID=2024425 RepID=UPI0017D6DD90|nr:GNAT family protein [Hamadaea sp.]NUR73311.1 GNAT family N-acetyltransferase [Hamadaea sp.]NUT21510.1 GNAT family N-acetyltransferase [Hamadaea sp.]
MQPLLHLQLTVDELTLRATTEADLPALAATLPDDVELNPALPGADGDARLDRTARVYQQYWRNRADSRPGSWTLPFVVLRDGRILGEQTLEADDFGRLRTVETASWLVSGARGKGIGKRMRLAVLSLAFDHLGAVVAETEAWHHNTASLGVSRSLGYLPNGVYRHLDGDGADDMIRMRMPVETWRQHHGGLGVEIDGLAECLEWLTA